ncbi:MAG: hypothetical protein AB8F34_09125, partial [Akkermansiaceae bacterium]
MATIKQRRILLYFSFMMMACCAIQCSKKEQEVSVEEEEVSEEEVSDKNDLDDKTISSPIYAPQDRLELGDRSKASGGLVLTASPIGHEIKGKVSNSASVDLYPPGEHWDMSTHSYLRIDFTNNGSGLVWVKGRLD